MPKIIFTKHAQDRCKQRGITLKSVEETITSPAQRFEQTEPQGAVKFIKSVDGRRLHVVATYVPNENAWLIISVWVRGEEDKRPLEDRLLISPFKLAWWIGKALWKIVFRNKSTQKLQ